MIVVTLFFRSVSAQFDLAIILSFPTWSCIIFFSRGVWFALLLCCCCCCCSLSLLFTIAFIINRTSLPSHTISIKSNTDRNSTRTTRNGRFKRLDLRRAANVRLYSLIFSRFRKQQFICEMWWGGENIARKWVGIFYSDIMRHETLMSYGWHYQIDRAAAKTISSDMNVCMYVCV